MPIFHLVHRAIESARLLKGALPEKIWIKVLELCLFFIVMKS